MSTKIKDVDRYLQSLDNKRKAALTAIRALIFENVPGVIETMQNGIPTYEIDGRIIVSFASRTNYMAIYFNNKEIFETHEDAFSHLDRGDGVIRFHDIEEIPMDEVRQILEECMHENHNKG